MDQSTKNSRKIKDSQKQKSPKDNFCSKIFRCFRKINKQPKSQHISDSPVKYVAPSKPLNLQPKKILMLDLDETLVRSTNKETTLCDFKVETNTSSGKVNTYFVFLREGCLEFLWRMSFFYQLGIFTASPKDYAEKIIEKIDTKNIISLRFFRDDCDDYNGIKIKDLRKVQRDLSNVILIDNLKESFQFQPENGLLIKPFYAKRLDVELPKLSPFLERLANFHDVRPVQENYKKFKLQFKTSVTPSLSVSGSSYKDQRCSFQELEKITKSLQHQNNSQTIIKFLALSQYKLSENDEILMASEKVQQKKSACQLQVPSQKRNI